MANTSSDKYLAESGFKPAAGYYDTLRAKVQQLGVDLGFWIYPTIPVPGIFLTSEGTDKANGKAPSRWCSDGRPQMLNKELRERYKDPLLSIKAIDVAEQLGVPIGLGTFGRADVETLDFDAKHWGTDADGVATLAARVECARVVNNLRTRHQIEGNYCEKTPGGGWHLMVGVDAHDTRKNFQLRGVDVGHCGEVLRFGDPLVIAPTITPRGPYELETGHRFDRVPSLENLGIEFVGLDPAAVATVEVTNAEIEEMVAHLRKPAKTPGVPLLSDLLRGMSSDLLDGKWVDNPKFLKGDSKQPDRSYCLTTVLNEGLSWIKWCGHNSKPFVDDLFMEPMPGEKLNGIKKFVSELEAVDKFERVLETVLKRWPNLSLLSHRYTHGEAELDYKRACPAGGTAGEPMKPDDVRKPAHLIEFLGQWLGGRLKWDEMRQEMLLDNKPVENPELLYLDLAEETGIDMPKVVVQDCYITASKRNRFNPVRDYLQLVRTNLLNGQDADHLVPVYEIGARFWGITDPFQSLLFGKHLMALVDRAYEQGCEHQTCLVLRGPQGVGKSLGLKALAPTKSLYVGSDELPGDKDLLMLFSQAWIYEFEEIDRMFHKRTVSAIKALISRSVDNYRSPYERKTREWPRVAVLFGTTNQEQFLVDETGERRWWVVDVENPVDIDQIRVNRDLIWASVMAAMDAGECRHLQPEQYQLSAANAATASRESLMLDRVQAWLGNKPWVTTAAVLSEVLQLEVVDLAKTGPKTGAVREVFEVLKQLGWKKTKETVRGLPGGINTRDVWFANDCEHSRNGEALMEMFRERGLKVPTASAFTGVLQFHDGMMLSASTTAEGEACPESMSVAQAEAQFNAEFGQA